MYHKQTNKNLCWAWWLTSIIPATLEAEIGQIKVQGKTSISTSVADVIVYTHYPSYLGDLWWEGHGPGQPGKTGDPIQK
jgi:hypothetical protein